jgi:hypothetical protein
MRRALRGHSGTLAQASVLSSVASPSSTDRGSELTQLATLAKTNNESSGLLPRLGSE